MYKLACLAGGITLAYSSVAFAAEPTNPNILQGIQQLQVNDVQQSATLQAIQTTLQGLVPPPVSNVAVTPAFETDGKASMTCSFVNRLAGTTVLVEIINREGAVIGN